MILKFQSGKSRLAVDLDKKTYNDNYFYLGGWDTYIDVKSSDLKQLKSEFLENGYTYDKKFGASAGFTEPKIECIKITLEEK